MGLLDGPFEDEHHESKKYALGTIRRVGSHHYVDIVDENDNVLIAGVLDDGETPQLVVKLLNEAYDKGSADAVSKIAEG